MLKRGESQVEKNQEYFISFLSVKMFISIAKPLKYCIISIVGSCIITITVTVKRNCRLILHLLIKHKSRKSFNLCGKSFNLCQKVRNLHVDPYRSQIYCFEMNRLKVSNRIYSILTSALHFFWVLNSYILKRHCRIYFSSILPVDPSYNSH